MTATLRSFSLKTTSCLRGLLNFFHASVLLMARRYRSASLRFKIAFFVVILLTSTSFILSIITVQIMNNYILNEIIKRGESVGKSIAASAGYNLLPEDLLGLANLVFKAKSSNSDMLYVAIVDSDMRTIVHSDTGRIWKNKPVAKGRLYREAADGTIVKELKNSSGSTFEIIYPIVFMKKSLGSVIIGMNRSIPLEAQRKVRNMILIAFGFIVVLGIFASSLLANFLIKPIKELSAGVEELKYGTAKNPLRIYSQDELGKLTRDFNEMAALIADQQGKLAEYNRDLEEAYVSMVKVVAAAIDARDSYTHGHSARVAQLSLLIGKKLDLSEEDLRDLEVACLFHDVGKIKTPDSILRKPDKLTEDEQKKMRQHVEDGASILSWAPSLSKYIPSTRHHHEWHNGKGYPDSLVGNDIPLFAAIISIGDAFDAMTTDRPYRKALSKEEALREVARMSGIQFRPNLVEIFLSLLENGRPQDIPLYIESVYIANNYEEAFEGYEKESLLLIPRILLIDDDENIRSILSELLDKIGYDVDVAEDGEEGIKLFDEMGDFDLVISDIQMPNMDGNEVARYIRNSDKSGVPLIAITGFRTEVQPEMFDYTLIKPFSLKDFGLIVKSFELTPT